VLYLLALLHIAGCFYCNWCWYNYHHCSCCCSSCCSCCCSSCCSCCCCSCCSSSCCS